MNDAIPPQQQMVQMITGYWVTQIIRAAAHLSLADHLDGRSMTAQEIAQVEGIDATGCARFLRACAALGLIAMDGDRASSTALLDTLRKGPGSLRGFALSQAAPGHWLPWGRFIDAVKTGERQTLATLDAEIFDYYQVQTEEGASFTEAMRGMSAVVSSEVERLVDTGTHRHAVDVGGASGALLFALLQANPALTGTVYDLPTVVQEVAALAQEAGVGDRVDAVGGDFNAQVPEGDLYLLKYILHD